MFGFLKPQLIPTKDSSPWLILIDETIYIPYYFLSKA